MSPTGSSTRAADSAGFFEEYMQEILRWNQTMNLVSRRNTLQVCNGLLEQCRGTFQLFWSWLESSGLVSEHGRLFYGDLGSGAGLPGVVWNQLFHRQGADASTVLVEPREKRAWFLNRVLGLENCTPFHVFRGRWGDECGDCGILEPSSIAVLSLKALYLNDLQVLKGLVAYGSRADGFAGGFDNIVIVRFYPPDQQLDSVILSDLGDASDVGPLLDSGPRIMLRQRHILGPTKGLLPASLVLTHYGVPKS